MKVTISEQTARKALDTIPADTQDQDLQQLRDRLEQGLKNVTAAGALTLDELATLLHLVTTAQDGDYEPGSTRPAHLRRIEAKLVAIRDRRRFEGGHHAEG